jgi:hypothetical protein
MMISLLSFYASVFESSVNLFVLSVSMRFASPPASSPMTWLLLLRGVSVVVLVAESICTRRDVPACVEGAPEVRT